MTQYIGQITVIIDTEDESIAETLLCAIAQGIEDESDAVVFADHNGDVENYESLEAECQDSLESAQSLPQRFDAYEIQPCRRYIDMDEPDIAFVEPCQPYEADFWTVYGHISGEGVQAIGDFDSRQHAEEVFARITGQGYNRATPRARS
ncbi:MAG TPA: hypothetical protein VHC22_19250 [Pirellulales bacterium]|nr:hypothetical protein [Pirellulales bacterium]